MLTKHTKTFTYGDREVTLETGQIARQADAAVMARIGNTVVLVTVVARKEAAPGQGFFPLTINYQEKTYAAGKIPGGFFKREGRPAEEETLTARLVDRPLRPLFPKGFLNEVQVIATTVSIDDYADTEVVTMLGASAALALSGVPFAGPIGAARVAHINDELVLNPNKEQLQGSRLNLVVAGTDQAVLMVESEADLLPEATMLDAVMFGHEQMQVAITAIKELAAEVGKPAWEWSAPEADQELATKVAEQASDALTSAYTTVDKQERQAKVAEGRDAAIDALASDEGWSAADVSAAYGALEKRIVRSRILDGERRIDGRDTSTVRPIHVETSVLPTAHGSALFTRGETQALVVTTLGTARDAQIIDSIAGERKENFLFHYNFPPFCVGETGFIGSPKRREVGHGRLAKRGVLAVMPDVDNFPYTVRIVSEITESNGSSSMASVCGSSLALMDAGVPVTHPVAGIAMGLVKEGDRFAVLTDILGDEDHLGDMDFKVAGAAEGITALQMDIKIDGITREIMQQALDQARDGRLFILGEMAKVLDTPRAELSELAPRYLTVKIDPEKIASVIGKGGAVIRSITEETGASIDIEDDGTIRIASVDRAAGEAAKAKIEMITADVEVGAVYTGTVARLMDFGAFVNILPGKDGLVHISQISEERVQNVADELSEGQVVKVKVLEIDKQGRIRLSMKAVEGA